MAKAKGSLIPMRGSIEDWGPGKQQRNLEAKEAYARKMREQATKGPPDFDTLLSLGTSPSEEPRKKRARAVKKKATRRQTKKATSRKKKKKATRGRR
jgi:hypothetical protein